MATQYARASYMEVIDLQTVPDKTTVIGIHTPVGRTPYTKMKGFFQQFRKFRYKGISSIKSMPASSLPVDPLGLTVQEQSVDQISPVDVWNPILFKGCHGTSLDQILDSIFGAGEYVEASKNDNHEPLKSTSLGDAIGSTPSARLLEINNVLDTAYYKYLTDPSWRKFGIQQPLRIRNLYPLVWKMARNLPLVPGLAKEIYANNAGVLQNLYLAGAAYANANPAAAGSDAALNKAIATTPVAQDPTVGIFAEREYAQEFTNGCSRLGWLPTVTPIQTDASVQTNVITGLPKLFMGVLVMPPCYNIQQFQRLVIKHEFEFRDFTTSLGGMANYNDPNPVGDTGTTYFNFIEYQDESKKDDGFSYGTTVDGFNGSGTVRSEGVM